MNDEVNTEIHECDGSVKVDARGMAMIVLLAAVAGLAAMGIVFCWCCPDRLHDVGGVASRWCFKRQVVWNLAGVCAALAAVLAITATWEARKSKPIATLTIPEETMVCSLRKC